MCFNAPEARLQAQHLSKDNVLAVFAALVVPMVLVVLILVLVVVASTMTTDEKHSFFMQDLPSGND